MNLVPPTIDFREETHQYFVDGKEKVFPSKVIKDLRLGKEYGAIDPQVVANAGARGSAVHKVLELHVKGEIDNYEIPEKIKPYYEAFLSFLRGSRCQLFGSCSELAVYSGLHDYCTTIDIVGIIDGARSIIDYKTSASFDKAVELQTAAQQIAYNEWHEEKVTKRYSLQLKKDGTYKLRNHTNVDLNAFLGALEQWNNGSIFREDAHLMDPTKMTKNIAALWRWKYERS